MTDGGSVCLAGLQCSGLPSRFLLARNYDNSRPHLDSSKIGQTSNTSSPLTLLLIYAAITDSLRSIALEKSIYGSKTFSSSLAKVVQNNFSPTSFLTRSRSFSAFETHTTFLNVVKILLSLTMSNKSRKVLLSNRRFE